MRKLFAIGLICVAGACTTDSEHVVKEIDTDIEKSGRLKTATMAITRTARSLSRMKGSRSRIDDC